MYYDKYSRGSKAYMALAGEIIRREEKLAAEQLSTAALAT
jgi:chromosome partitioning protein